MLFVSIVLLLLMFFKLCLKKLTQVFFLSKVFIYKFVEELYKRRNASTPKAIVGFRGFVVAVFYVPTEQTFAICKRTNHYYTLRAFVVKCYLLCFFHSHMKSNNVFIVV
jgi:hypothetical protein